MEISKSLHFPLSLLLLLLLPLLSIGVDARSSSFNLGNGDNHEKGLLQLFQNFPWKEHGEAVVNCIFQKPSECFSFFTLIFIVVVVNYLWDLFFLLMKNMTFLLLLFCKDIGFAIFFLVLKCELSSLIAFFFSL